MIGKIFGRYTVIKKIPQPIRITNKWGSMYIVKDENGKETKKSWSKLQSLLCLLFCLSLNASENFESAHRKINLDRQITRCILLQRVEVLNESIDKAIKMMALPECPVVIFSDNIKMVEDRNAIIRLIHTLGRTS